MMLNKTRIDGTYLKSNSHKKVPSHCTKLEVGCVYVLIEVTTYLKIPF